MVKGMWTYASNERYKTRDVVPRVRGGIDVDPGFAVEESVFALLVGK